MKSKSTRKKRNTYNQEAINALSEKHGFTTRFIRQCISGERNSLTADHIHQEYRSLTAPTNKRIEQFKKQ
ncbi:hypothetical protein LS482_16020 [Sinomicrobium kalidii]|uniref:hypothetical protein n=1 Tax=Sinomicrobium kalidii TaxID=2900738 RepID=UPI001E406C7A|nr:hypothetical protein [Sinomicrobium kalidii]UGU15179.1 hypothetical protein LS482_16020 [Sinomicrobium kalidii]